MNEPTLLPIGGLSLAAAPTAPEAPPMPFATMLLWRTTVASWAVGLVAQVVPAPPQVSWAAVALSAVGAFALAVRLTHSYLMARLEVDRISGENRALKAELEAVRVARPLPAALARPSEQ